MLLFVLSSLKSHIVLQRKPMEIIRLWKECGARDAQIEYVECRIMIRFTFAGYNPMKKTYLQLKINSTTLTFVVPSFTKSFLLHLCEQSGLLSNSLWEACSPLEAELVSSNQGIGKQFMNCLPAITNNSVYWVAAVFTTVIALIHIIQALIGWMIPSFPHSSVLQDFTICPF